jgi:hypothetical protein
MKVLRIFLIALASTLAATVAVTLTVRESSAAAASCGLWDYCFCMEVDCYMGDQLCATGPGFECYQWD